MKKMTYAIPLFVAILMSINCGSDRTSTTTNTAVQAITGRWNVEMTETGSTSITFTMGMQLTQSGADVTGSNIPYSGSVGHDTSCPTAALLTSVVGKVSGTSVALIATNPSATETFNFTGNLNGPKITGTYTATAECEGPHLNYGSSTGSVAFTRQ